MPSFIYVGSVVSEPWGFENVDTGWTHRWAQMDKRIDGCTHKHTDSSNFHSHLGQMTNKTNIAFEEN